MRSAARTLDIVDSRTTTTKKENRKKKEVGSLSIQTSKRKIILIHGLKLKTGSLETLTVNFDTGVPTEISVTRCMKIIQKAKGTARSNARSVGTTQVQAIAY